MSRAFLWSRASPCCHNGLIYISVIKRYYLVNWIFDQWYPMGRPFKPHYILYILVAISDICSLVSSHSIPIRLKRVVCR
jgi:hypothetical protein